MGPWIETDFDIDADMIHVRVNGRQVIEFRTSQMIFGVVDYLVEITKYITLMSTSRQHPVDGHRRACRPHQGRRHGRH